MNRGEDNIDESLDDIGNIIDEALDDIGDIIDEALDRDAPGINTREQ